MDGKLFIDCVPIKYFPGEKCVFIRELCGYDEQNIKGIRSYDAIKLLNNLFVENVNSSAIFGNAHKLTITDRDRILSAIYMNTYGIRIETTSKCNSCRNNFDIDF